MLWLWELYVLIVGNFETVDPYPGVIVCYTVTICFLNILLISVTDYSFMGLVSMTKLHFSCRRGCRHLAPASKPLHLVILRCQQ